MKKLAKLLVAVLTVAVMACSAFSLVGCDDGKTTVDCSKGHVDANSDGVCDNCKAAIVTLVDCTDGHVDANNDGKCDKCKGAAINELPAACAGHVDVNHDGKCDLCDSEGMKVQHWHDVAEGQDFNTETFQFTPNGKCSVCGVALETGVELSADSYTLVANTKALMQGAGICDAKVIMKIEKDTSIQEGVAYKATINVLWNVYGMVKWAIFYSDANNIFEEGYSTTVNMGQEISGYSVGTGTITKGDRNIYSIAFNMTMTNPATQQEMSIPMAPIQLVVHQGGAAEAYMYWDSAMVAPVYLAA